MIKKILAGIAFVCLIIGGFIFLIVLDSPEVDTFNEILKLAISTLAITIGLGVFMTIVVLLGGYALGLFDD